MMKVNYTLPGLLPDPASNVVSEGVESSGEPFGMQFRRLRAAEHTDWRAVLRLNSPPTGAAGIGPPPASSGFDLRDGPWQRAWWRGMLAKHARPIHDIANVSDHQAVQRMLSLLVESQQLEDEVFARHFAEGFD